MSAAAPAAVRTARTGRSPWLVPIALSALIVGWQVSFNSATFGPRSPFRMTASMGLCIDARNFFYFFHHYGVFPVGAREVPALGPSKRAADEFVARHGDRLTMDFGLPTNTSRFGDYGKLFLLYPDVLIRGDPGNPSTIPADELLFVAALLAVFWAFWLGGHGLLGTLIVALVGSDPFQVYETYGRGNVFSIPITVTLLALAAHVRFLERRQPVDRRAWAIAIASGAVLASAREIRAEAALVTATVFGAYLLARAPWPRRLALAAAFVAAFALTGFAWSRFWASEFARAEQFVARAGGQVFHGRRDTHHTLWHAIYCGLGDYGTDRGYSWDDRDAFRWATTRDPVTNPHPLPYHYTTGGYYFEETYDGVNHIAPTDLPEYNRLVRGRVLKDVREHPGWYAGILWQRLGAILRDATPVGFSIGSSMAGLFGLGWLPIPVLAFAFWRRNYFHAMLVLFVLPLSATALLVYSGKGMTFYGIAHLIALAVAVDLLVAAARSEERRVGKECRSRWSPYH